MTLPQALEAACLANDVEKVQILLGDFQYQRDIVTSVLHLACEKNLAGIIRLVLTVSSAADVKRLLETTNKSDNNPIHIACRHGALEAVKVLVEEGQDLPNRTSLVAREGGGKSSKTSVTPLHAACVGGNLALVQYLAGFNGVSLESRCSDGTSCMHLACVADALDIVKFLAVKAPSLMQAKSAQAFTPLTTCAGFLAAKCAPFVLEKTKPHKEDELFDLLILALRSTVAQKTNEDARCDTLRAILSYVEEGRVKAFVNRPVKDHPRKGLEERPVHIAAREGMYAPCEIGKEFDLDGSCRPSRPFVRANIARRRHCRKVVARIARPGCLPAVYIGESQDVRGTVGRKMGAPSLGCRREYDGFAL